MKKIRQDKSHHKAKIMELPSKYSLDFGRQFFNFAKEMGRLSIENADLAEYQRKILSDIISIFELPYATNVVPILSIISMFQSDAEKPPISISCTLTSKGNLSIIWAPNHFDLHLKPIASKLITQEMWSEVIFNASERQRPKNEIVFVRSVKDIPGFNFEVQLPEAC